MEVARGWEVEVARGWEVEVARGWEVEVAKGNGTALRHGAEAIAAQR